MMKLYLIKKNTKNDIKNFELPIHINYSTYP